MWHMLMYTSLNKVFLVHLLVANVYCILLNCRLLYLFCFILILVKRTEEKKVKFCLTCANWKNQADFDS